MKKETIRILEEMRNEDLFALQAIGHGKADEMMGLMNAIDALEDALCELRMIPKYNRDELMASLRYAQEHLAVDYSGMNAEAVEKLDDSLEAIFGIVSQLIGEEESK
jgi:hypothetical protein